MPYKKIAGLIPAIQAASLVEENVKVAKKKRKTTKDMISIGTKNIIGTSMIKINADLIAGL